jgi:hypothetical protein
VEAVQRVYLLREAPSAGGRTDPAPDPLEDGAPGDGIEVLDEVEYWCATCRESFPHVPVVGD